MDTTGVGCWLRSEKAKLPKRPDWRYTAIRKHLKPGRVTTYWEFQAGSATVPVPAFYSFLADAVMCRNSAVRSTRSPQRVLRSAQRQAPILRALRDNIIWHYK